MRLFKLIISASLAFSSAALSAADGQTSIFNYSRSDRNPVTAAMAGASMTNTSSVAWSALSNPSAAVFAPKGTQISATWQNWAPNSAATSAFNFAAGYNSGRFMISAAGTFASDKPYDIIGSDGLEKGQFSPKGLYAGLGIAYRIMDHLSLGADFKYFSSTLSSKTSYNGFGAGLMLTFHKDKFTAAAGVQDLGPKVSGKYSLPTSGAASFAFTMPSDLTHAIHLELDANYYLLGGFSAALGAQYSFKNMIFARAGYLLSSGAAPIGSHASVGLGAKWKAFELNLAFLTANEFIGSSMMAGLTVSF